MTCQIYIADTITEAMRSFPALGSQLARKSDWCRLNVKTDEIAPVEVMDAAANYFKHRDEWGLGHKNANRQGRQTLGILERALGQPVRERGCALVAAEFIGDVEVADVEKWLNQSMTGAKQSVELHSDNSRWRHEPLVSGIPARVWT